MSFEVVSLDAITFVAITFDATSFVGIYLAGILFGGFLFDAIGFFAGELLVDLAQTKTGNAFERRYKGRHIGETPLIMGSRLPGNRCKGVVNNMVAGRGPQPPVSGFIVRGR